MLSEMASLMSDPQLQEPPLKHTILETYQLKSEYEKTRKRNYSVHIQTNVCSKWAAAQLTPCIDYSQRSTC